MRHLLFASILTAVVQLPSAAQSVDRIGILGVSTESSPGSKQRLDIIRKTLQEHGYIEGKNLQIESRWAYGDTARLRLLAEDLVHQKVQVIITDGGTPAIIAAKNATQTIPIVFPTVGDPVRQGFVKSMAHPGGNLTGLSLQSPEIGQKQLEAVTEISARIRRYAYLTAYGNGSSSGVLDELRRVGAAMKIQIEHIQARIPGGLDDALKEVLQKHCDVLHISSNSEFDAYMATIADFAVANKLQTITDNSIYAEKGILVTLGSNRVEMARRAGIMVGKILKGADPANLPVEQPTTFQLVVNRKTAKALGIKIPQSLLIRADKVIE